MNKIVREHYPAAKLPDDLREGIDPSEAVTITVVVEERSGTAPTVEDILARRSPPYRSPEEIDAEVRALRDEWDSRD